MFADNPILSRSMAVGLLIAVIAGIWSVLVAPIVDQRNRQKAEIAQASRLIGEFEARREDIGALKQQLAAMRNDPVSAGAYFSSGNPTLAAAKLQSRIKALTEAAGARLASTQVLTGADSQKGSDLITVTATMIGSVEALRSVFYTLEASKPFVFLDNITITTRPSRARSRLRRGSAAASQGAGLVTVRFSAYGYLWQDKRT